jgi:hypothetical protein
VLSQNLLLQKVEKGVNNWNLSRYTPRPQGCQDIMIVPGGNLPLRYRKCATYFISISRAGASRIVV